MGIPQPMFQIRHFNHWNLSGIDRRRSRGGRGAAMPKKGIVVGLLALLGLPASMGAALLLHPPRMPTAPEPRIGQVRNEALARRQGARVGIEPIGPAAMQPVERARPRARRSARAYPTVGPGFEPGPSSVLPCRRRSC